jgi:hypothetical protein
MSFPLSGLGTTSFSGSSAFLLVDLEGLGAAASAGFLVPAEGLGGCGMPEGLVAGSSVVEAPAPLVMLGA